MLGVASTGADTHVWYRLPAGVNGMEHGEDGTMTGDTGWKPMPQFVAGWFAYLMAVRDWPFMTVWCGVGAGR